MTNAEYSTLPKDLQEAVDNMIKANKALEENKENSRRDWEFALYDLDSTLKNYENGNFDKEILADIRSKFHIY